MLRISLLLVALGAAATVSQATQDFSYLCASEPNGALVPHPYNCQAYFVCNIVPKMQYCDRGLHFDEQRSLCNWPEFAKCRFTTQNSGDQSTEMDGDLVVSRKTPFMAFDVETGRSTDPMAKYDPTRIECVHYGAYFLPHPHNCRRYFICSYGHLLSHSCGPKTFWNYETTRCELESEAQCYKPDPYKTTTVQTTSTWHPTGTYRPTTDSPTVEGSTTTTRNPTGTTPTFPTTTEEPTTWTPTFTTTTENPTSTESSTWHPTGSSHTTDEPSTWYTTETTTINPTGSTPTFTTTWYPTGSTPSETETTTRNPTGSTPTFTTTWYPTGSTPSETETTTRNPTGSTPTFTTTWYPTGSTPSETETTTRNPTGSTPTFTTTWYPTGSYYTTGETNTWSTTEPTTRNPTGTTPTFTTTDTTATEAPKTPYFPSTTLTSATSTQDTSKPYRPPKKPTTRPPKTTKAETENPGLTLSCPSDRQSYLPHSKDCSKYFICIVGMPVMTSCPEGLYWNQVDEFCDSPKNVKCLVN